MAQVNVSKVDYTVSVDKATNTVTVNTTPTTVIVNSEAYAPVSSVNTKTGDVVLTTTDIAEGTNQYWTNARFDTRFGSKGLRDLGDVDWPNPGPSAGDALVWQEYNGTLIWRPGSPSVASNAGKWTSPVTINLSGDVTGSTTIQGPTAADTVTLNTTIQPNSVALGTDTTGDYVASLVAGTGVTLSNNAGEGATPTVAIGQSVGTTDNVTFNTVTTNGLTTANSGLTVNGTLTANNDVVVNGNLTVNGTTTSIDTTNLVVEDNTVLLNKNETGAGVTAGTAGIEIERGSLPNTKIVWNESADRWQIQGYTIVGGSDFYNNVDIVLDGDTVDKAFSVQTSNMNLGPNGRIGFIDSSVSDNFHNIFWDNDLRYDSSTNTLTVGTVSGNLSGNATTASTATVASTVALTATNSTNSEHFVTFADSATGNEDLRTDTGLTYNPSTNTLTASTFAGNVTGTASIATNANNINVTTTSSSSNHYLTMTSGGTAGTYYDARVHTNLTYLPNQNSLKVGTGSFNNGLVDTGVVRTSAVRLRQSNQTNNNEVTILVNNSGSNDYTLTLPTTQGSAGTVLRNDGSGNLSWVNTDGITEGSTNRYFTNARARSAISVSDTGGYGSLTYDNTTGAITYAGPTGSDIRSEVVDGRNLTYTGSTLDVDTALVDVNSVTAATSNDLTLTGNRLVLKTRDVGGVADTFFTLDSDGYNFNGVGTTLGSNATGSASTIITNKGTTSEQFYSYLWVGDITLNSNQITNCKIYASNDVGLVPAALNWNTVSIVGHPALGGGSTSNFNIAGPFELGVKINSISIDPVDNTLATVTLTTSDGATSANATGIVGTQTGRRGRFIHYFRNSAKTVVSYVHNQPPGAYTITPGTPYPAGFYIGTGISSASNLITVDYWSHSYTVAPTAYFGARRLLRLESNNPINEHVIVPYGLGVGPGAISSNRGYPRDSADAIGINLYNPGTLNGYNGKTIFNLTQFADNSYYLVAANGLLERERCGGQFNFNHFRSNSTQVVNTTPTNNLYARLGDGVGRLTWWAFSGNRSDLAASSDAGLAGIYVKATQDLATRNVTGGGGMYLQHTPNSAGTAHTRTFLAAEDQQVELKAVNRIQFKPMVRNVSIPTASGTWDNTTKRLTLNFTKTYQYAPYGNSQRVNLTGFGAPYDTNANDGAAPWSVISCTTSSVVLEMNAADASYLLTLSAPSTFGTLAMNYGSRSDGTGLGLSAQHPHVWMEVSDYTPGSLTASAGTEGTGTKVTIGADHNDGDLGLILRRTVGNTANFELKLPTGTANRLELKNNSNSTTPVAVDNSKVEFAIPVKLPAYTATALTAITGEVGWMAAVSDQGGKLAYWDTTNTRWSFVHDNSAV